MIVLPHTPKLISTSTPDILEMDPTEQTTSDDPVTASKTPVPATSIQCKYCNRHFATISVEDGFVPVVSQLQACDSCEPFLGLHETLRIREHEHKALLDRGPKHHGRALAHEKFRNARVMLENFLLSIEAPNEATFDVAQVGFANRADPAQPVRTDNTTEVPRFEDSQRDSRGECPHAKRFSPTRKSPIVKPRLGRDSKAAKLERKRIKFTESVEERPEYRPTNEFYRGGKEYIPGRYGVAAGSEYLDTSGSTLTFTKFTGQKRVGSRFVDIVPKVEPQEGGDGVSAMKSKGRSNLKRKQGGQEEVGGHKDLEYLGSGAECAKDNDQTNSRALRSTRRYRSTTPPVMNRPRRSVARYDGQDEDALNNSQLKPSLIVTMKTSLPLRESVFAESTHTPQHGERLQELSRGVCHGEATGEAAEIMNINQVVTNLERELCSLQQATITPRYTRMASVAVRGILEILEPLKKLSGARPDGNEEVGQVEEAIEDDSVYFDALDATDKAASEDALHSSEALEEVEDSQIWADAASHIEAAGESKASPTFDVNGVGQNIPTASALQRAEHDYEHDQRSLVPSVDAGLGNLTNGGLTEGSTIARRRSRHRSSRSRNLPRLSATKRGPREVTPHPNGTVSDDEGSARKVPETPVEVTLRVSPSKTSCNEATRDLHQIVNKWANDHVEKQDIPVPCKSEAPNGSPQASGIDQDLDTTPAGSAEARKPSEVHIADTDRRGAEAQVETTSDRGLSAKRRINSDIESLDKEMLGVDEQSSRSLLDFFGVGYDSKIKMAVTKPLDNCTAAFQVGVQSEPLNKTCLENLAQDNCRKHSLQANREVSYAHEVPDDAFDVGTADCVWQPQDITTAEPQADKDYASAVPEPSEITPQASHQAPANEPSSHLQSEIAVCLGDITNNAPKPLLEPQDPENLSSVFTAAEMHDTEINKAGVARVRARSCDGS